MSFLIPCPHCGARDTGEFRFGGEYKLRPPDPAALDAFAWAHFVYDRENAAGPQTEWWYHRGGCRVWFLAVRDTVTNAVEKTWLP